MPESLFCLKELWFFTIPICTCINSVRKILGNQIVVTPSIKVIPFSKYLSFHLGVALVHANWTKLIDPAADPTCSLCKGEPQTLERWLQICTNLDGFRQHTFGSPLVSFGRRIGAFYIIRHILFQFILES